LAVPASMKEVLARRIAGEIILSNQPGVTMRKWREAFDISQVRLAERLGLSSSVISDYESGRRLSPGTRFVKRFVESLISVGEEGESQMLRQLARLSITFSDAIVDMREFPVPVKARRICEAVNGVVLANEPQLSRDIYGYTVVDSMRALETLSGTDFYQMFGSTTERAVVFTGVSSGRSPMVAIRVHPLKPRMVVIQGPVSKAQSVDKLGVMLAELEQIPYVMSRITNVDRLVTSLNDLYRAVSSARLT